MSQPKDTTWSISSRVANQDVESGAWGNESGWNAFMQGGLPREQERDEERDEERDQGQRAVKSPERDGEDHGNVQMVTGEMPQDTKSERPSV